MATKERNVGERLAFRALCAAVIRLTTLGSGLLLAHTGFAASMLSLLTLDGDVQPLADRPAQQLRRIAPAENGFGVVIDEYALVKAAKSGASILFATDAFDRGQAELADANRRLASGSPDVSNLRTIREPLGLVIRHQRGHDPGHNFTPTPIAEFRAQRVAPVDLEGQRGFAIVAIGETGRILKVTILTRDGPIRRPDLQAAIAAGTRSTFQDARRHDHTLYFAYRISAQEIVPIGRPIVTLPMCCNCDPDPYDGIEYQCP